MNNEKLTMTVKDPSAKAQPSIQKVIIEGENNYCFDQDKLNF